MAPPKRSFTPPPGTAQGIFSLASMLQKTEDKPMVAFHDIVSADGRRAHRLSVPMGGPPSPIKNARLAQMATPSRSLFAESDVPMVPVSDTESYKMSLWLDDDGAGLQEPLAKKPDGDTAVSDEGSPADPALATWLAEYRDIFLGVLLWTDGRGAAAKTSHCRRCSRGPALVRCVECLSEMVCADCCVAMHDENPLHWVEMWTGEYFKRISLQSLGLRIQLGHPPRETCSIPRSTSTNFTVIHTNGIHTLLRRRWYPATVDQPNTCATFSCLDTAQTLSLQAKISTYDYYASLEWLTDGSGKKPSDRYRVLLRLLRQWRHLLMLKRAGRGHEEGGVAATLPGELALRCPACPRPGVNLPEGWENARQQDQCLYTLFIAIDACFRLKRRMVSSFAKDPSLGAGAAYMVEWEPYRQFLLTITDQVEISTCTGFRALDYANTKFSRGYSVTGVGMCICARHEFVFPNGVADLQKGERYGNMDYVFASVMRHTSRQLRIIASYDIACQWFKNLAPRLAKLPKFIRLHIVLHLFRFVVPKMHIKAHTLACQLLFSLYLAPGSGQTDGEGIERFLDDHWGFSNWRKLVGLPSLLRRRLDGAHVELQQQEAAFSAFSDRQSQHIDAWTASVHNFEAPLPADAPAPPNPYEVVVPGLSERELRQKLAKEEEQQPEALKIHTITPSTFIAFGLHIEEQQEHIRIQAELRTAGSSPSPVDLEALRRKCDEDQKTWRDLLATYSPASLVRLQRLKLADNVLSENVPLLFPSALSAAERESGCQPGIVSIEIAFREAQCREALVKLRNQLHIKSRLVLYKKVHSQHQGANTRSRAITFWALCNAQHTGSNPEVQCAPQGLNLHLAGCQHPASRRISALF
ncbi:CxC2 domain-containing protein [Mycena chlorophos]|uniref:CxC2 domain-containing protein n=1 Tax=Mycena chlorophos TaxID=658473 RepID=A0A8H6TCN6_MYCCL|nr:CxC2 domain-containing protein [Mycena chlorophos]